MTLPAVTIGFIKVKFPLTSVQGVGKENWAWSGLQNFEQGKKESAPTFDTPHRLLVGEWLGHRQSLMLWLLMDTFSLE